MGKAYTNLGKFYESIISDSNYKTFINYVVSLVNNNTNGREGLDVGCGSGILTRQLKKQGYKITGIDNSEEMLFEAKNNAINEGLNITFLKEDIRSLKYFNKVDFITACNDVFNYIQSKCLAKTFKNLYKLLNKGGVLVFDISSEYKLKNILSNNAFGDDDENLTYLWLNSYNKELNAVEMSLSFFEKIGKNYNRYDETQIQFIHTTNEIDEVLKGVGFKIVNKTDENGNELKENSNRIVYLVKK